MSESEPWHLCQRSKYPVIILYNEYQATAYICPRLVNDIRKELDQIPLLQMDWSTDKIPEYRPSYQEFTRPWDCINFVGKEMGGRFSGVGAIIPPAEWNPDIWPIEKIHESPRVSGKW